jgi:hypothetical protein
MGCERSTLLGDSRHCQVEDLPYKLQGVVPTAFSSGTEGHGCLSGALGKQEIKARIEPQHKPAFVFL